MKKFMVVLVLMLACGLFANTKILKEVPVEYQGTYYMIDKNEQMYLGEMQSNTMIHMDGAVSPITEISIEVLEGKKTLIVKFSATKEYFKIIRIDENFYAMYLCDAGASKCAYTLIITIKKGETK